ncbi:3-oxosteroid 1-dehydrogenase [Rhodoligotrophos appendicifer]|uniref:FAD-dependent oxidoreductase n=1 Tax=Rhodoligotrophos appendicifer TaxID=987056 RepID=UPI0011855207|nr:FAD-dependent oxidoreductase [Rhodoligotrophos appendicifer]
MISELDSHAGNGATRPEAETFDVVIVGSGSAALSAALRAATGGLSVVILEKSDKLGGTSAMSGSGTWIPANHVARRAGMADSQEEALEYIRSASPEGWHAEEDEHWQKFIATAPRMLEFLEQETPLEFALAEEPDIFADRPGGKGSMTRMLSPKPLSRRLLGRYGPKLRRSTLPQLFTYQEVYDGDLYHSPISVFLKLWPKLIWRYLTQTRAMGNALMIGLIKGCLDKGCRFELETRVVELIQDEDDGRIRGVVAETGGKRRSVHARRGVVLATGGFEWNKELFSKHFPGPLDRIGSPRTNSGDGQLLAQKAGAALDRMDQANVYPTLPTRYEGELHGIPMTYQAEPHAIMVDRTGKRFASEYDFNIGKAIDRRDPETGEPVHLPIWMITDQRYMRLSLPFLWYARKDPSWIVKANTLEELAGKTGLPADVLKETVARFNRFCEQGRDDDFHRGEGAWESFKAGGTENAFGTIEKPPYYAMSVNRSIMGTKGGARTNIRGEVLRPDRSVIPGLYAAGLAMANPIGTLAIGAGTTIGPNLTWGFVCGESLLMTNRGDD